MGWLLAARNVPGRLLYGIAGRFTVVPGRFGHCAERRGQNQTKNIYAKLGVDSRRAAVRRAEGRDLL